MTCSHATSELKPGGWEEKQGWGHRLPHKGAARNSLSQNGERDTHMKVCNPPHPPKRVSGLSYHLSKLRLHDNAHPQDEPPPHPETHLSRRRPPREHKGPHT